MKKILALLLALIMLLSFAGCSEENPEEGKTEDPGVEVVPERGTAKDGFYKNEAFGISFETESDRYFLSDSEIAQSMGTTAEKLFGEGITSETDYFCDVYCVDMESGTTVSVTYENLGTIGGFTEPNQYLEMLATELVSSQNDSVSESSLSVNEIDGEKIPCLNITLNYSGTTIYQRIIVKKIGTWIGTVTLATLDSAELETLVAGFSFK